MAVDRGGLRYNIEAKDEFSAATGKFIAEIKAMRAGIEGLQTVAAKGVKVSKLQRGLEESSRAGKQLAKDMVKVGRETGLVGKSLADEVTARRKIAAEQRKINVEIRRAKKASDENFASIRRGLGITRARARAEREVQRALDKRTIQEQKLVTLKERGLQNDLELKKALGVLTTLEKERLKATEALSKAQAQGDKETRRLSVQAKILRTINAAEEKRAVAAGLAAKGLNSEGENRQVAARAQAEKDIQSILDRRLVQKQRLQALEARGLLNDKALRKELGLLTSLEKEREAAARRLAQAQNQGDAQTRRLSVQAKILRTINAAEERRAVMAGLAAKGRDAQGFLSGQNPNNIKNIKETETRIQRLNKVLGKSQNQANRVSFTFRRLFGIMAAFTVVRRLAQAFISVTKNIITMSAAIEQAQLGIASLFAAVGTIRDPFGNTVSSAEALVLAQKEARRQTNLLRQDALRTTATFRVLLDTFQVAIAPGLSSGLNIDEVRDFTVQISQAAAAIGLQQNQLAEEIRSILQGTIQSRTTRIAVALGITNEDIRNAKEAGVLADFLTQKFISFNEAGKASFETFNGLVARIQDGFELLLISGGVEFFNEVKTAARELFELITTSDSVTGAITPSANAVKIVEQIARGLKDSVRAARLITRNLRFEDAMRLAKGLGTVLSTAGQVIVGMFEGSVIALGTVFDIIGNLRKEVRKIFGLTDDGNKSIRDIVRDVTKVAVFLISIQLITATLTSVLGLISLGVGLLLAPLSAVLGLVIAIDVASGPIGLGALIISLIVIGIVLAVVGLLALFKKLASETTGIDLKWSTFLKLIKVNATFVVKRLLLAFKRIGSYIANGLYAAVLGVGALLSAIIFEPLILVAKVLKKLGLVSEEQVNGLKKVGRAIARELVEHIDNATASAQALDEELEKITKERDDGFVEVLINADKDPTLGQAAKDGVLGLFDGIGTDIQDKIFGDTFGPNGILGDGVGQANLLVDAFNQLQPSASRAAVTLTSLSTIAKRLKDDIKETTNSLLLVQSTLGLEGGTKSVVSAAFKSQIQLKKDGKKIDEEILQVRRDIVANAIKQATIERRRIALSTSEKDVLEQIEVTFDQMRLNQQALTDLEIKRLKIQKDINTAKENGLSASDDEAALKGVLGNMERIIQAQADLASLSKEEVARAREEKVGVEQLVKLASDRIKLAGLAKGLSENDRLLLLEKKNLESKINTILFNRIAATSLESSNDKELSNRKLLFDVEKKRLDVEFLHRSEQSTALATAELAVSQSRQEIVFLKEKGDAQLQNLESLKETIRLRIGLLEMELLGAKTEEDRKRISAALTAGEGALAGMKSQINTLQKEQNLLLEEANLNLTESEDRLQHARDIIERPLATGFKDTLLAFVQEQESALNTLAVNVTNTFLSIGSLGAQTIADIFDPSVNVNLKQRIGNFLKGLGTQILQTLLNQILAKLIAKIVALFVVEQAAEASKIATNTAAASVWISAAVPWTAIANTLLIAATLLSASGGIGYHAGGAIGKAEGGTIGGPSASRAPAGLHHTDKIPIWAAKDEFMIRARSAMMYGHDIMDRINKGLVDPYALRALVGSGKIGRQVSNIPRRGLASGGPVLSSSVQSAGAPEDVTGGSPIAAFIVPDEQAAERLLAGGAQAFIRFMDQEGYRRG